MTTSLSFTQTGVSAGQKPCALALGDFALLLPGLMAAPVSGDDIRQSMAAGGKILPVPLPLRDSDAADGEADETAGAATGDPLDDDSQDDRLLADAVLMLALPGWPVPVAADPVAPDVAADPSIAAVGDEAVSHDAAPPVAIPVASDDGPIASTSGQQTGPDTVPPNAKPGAVLPRSPGRDVEAAEHILAKAASVDGKRQAVLADKDMHRIAAASTDGQVAAKTVAAPDRATADVSPMPAPIDAKDGAKPVLTSADDVVTSPRITLKSDGAAIASAPAPRAVAPDPVADSIARPAGQVFAARIVAALDAPAPSASRRTSDDRVAAPLIALTGSVPTDLTARPVSAPVSADQPQLNTRDADWIEKLVDRIDMMRTDSGARETRIRLSPDALGALDVRIEDKDGQMRVHFSADHAATRALIADAAPRLADLAEARGLKLTQGFADGQGQPAARQDQSQQDRPAARPASAFDTGADSGADTGKDGRIA